MDLHRFLWALILAQFPDFKNLKRILGKHLAVCVLLFVDVSPIREGHRTVALVRERTVRTERTPLAEEVSTNFFR
jgi:hypothetical protein